MIPNFKLEILNIFYTLSYQIFTELRRNKMKKNTTASEQFLIQIGNTVETEAISIPLTYKYVDHLS
jgi:hypothetical protein